MKAYVNQEECIGCGLCAETCPAVFSMDGDKAVAYSGDVPANDEDCTKKATEGCPVGAISIE